LDNVTHTLIGVLAGEAIAVTLPPGRQGLPEGFRRNLVVAVMAVGSNLPDLDFLYGATTHNKLDYLLQHRGYTHTVVGALCIALLAFAACEAWIRWRGNTAIREDRLAIFGVALLAPLLHVAMDFGNNYGVHPFWPFYNGWIYGDSIFIVEPLYWAAAAPLIFVLKTWVARALVGLILAGGVVLSAISGMVPLPFIVLLISLAALMLAVGYKAAPRTALWSGIFVWLAVTTLFAIGHHLAANQIESKYGFIGDEIELDHVLTPMPSNPICWDVLLVQSSEKSYFLRQGVLSLAPRWMPANTCPSRMASARPVAPLAPMTADESDMAAIYWRGEIELSQQRLRDLDASSCQASALLRFARAPFYAAHNGLTLVGDLRYAREPGAGFAETELGKDPCPVFKAPWTPPRADLLSP
jgi:inner membrane protein